MLFKISILYAREEFSDYYKGEKCHLAIYTDTVTGFASTIIPNILSVKNKISIHVHNARKIITYLLVLFDQFSKQKQQNTAQ